MVPQFIAKPFNYDSRYIRIQQASTVEQYASIPQHSKATNHHMHRSNYLLYSLTLCVVEKLASAKEHAHKNKVSSNGK